ncbi:sulfotransferase [Profundibacterium mesophilum]|uniref:Sulfotransferase familydomain containing protein n=1 Tax=Profundibacterium mesophilum KAUST100406-0324 TaxID=1037889 RepID=A0A921TDQ9_9RHOB|nr:sulfotransferase [Profundibacterium mesophilum]KAF0674594.1 Sulfotransferase familydomain containing protein [Profundibacterium mesophilum KAUST100406-0324]
MPADPVPSQGAAFDTAPSHVIIVTYGRSGSTLLQNLLNGLEGYCIRGENNNALFHAARAWHALVGAEPVQGLRRTGETTGPDHPWYGAETVDTEAFGAAMARAFLADVLRPPAGTRVAGFKEIRFHHCGGYLDAYLDFILRFVPDPRFVFNTRDHAATARSGWWAAMDPDAVKRELDIAEACFARMRERLGERAIAVHYDDYVADIAALEPLFAFLGDRPDKRTVARVMGRRLPHSGVD